MKSLEYPFDENEIYQRRRKLRKMLLQELGEREEKDLQVSNVRIAVLGGATTNDVCECLELFLLKHGIRAQIYQSGFNKFYEEAVFDNAELKEFNPDVIYIYTSSRNIVDWPGVEDSIEEVERKLAGEYERFVQVWKGLSNYGAIIIQNNFEYLAYRVLGNLDGVSHNGRTCFINRLNERFRAYALENKSFYINDINYLSTVYGLDRWRDDSYWYMYKMSQAPGGTTHIANSVANIIKAVYGRNKKAFVLDLDNTLWGGVVSEEGKDGIELGPDTPMGEAYLDFHRYLLEQKKMGITLNIASKNDKEVAMEGFDNKYSILGWSDFMITKTNWEPKSNNINAIAKEINISSEAIVFVDDNPVERTQVMDAMEGIGVPKLTTVENYIKEIDRNGYFECVSLTEDDLKRSEMYMNNLERAKESVKYSDYKDFLKGLAMKTIIDRASNKEVDRVSQLLNKCNQFNLTTRKYTLEEIKDINDKDNLVLYASLSDKFGDNGIVSAVVCSIEGNCCSIDNWVMSCRVLKRELEQAIMDVLVRMCKEEGVTKIVGRYIASPKNSMVKNLYRELGFIHMEDEVWCYQIPTEYENKNVLIDVVNKGEE